MPSAVIPLRGRDEELRTLGESLAAAARGEGGAVVVLGEPGSGRTSIAAEAARAATGFAVLSSGGSPVEAEIPGACLHRLLRPMRDAFEGLAAHHADALRAVTEGRLRQADAQRAMTEGRPPQTEAPRGVTERRPPQTDAQRPVTEGRLPQTDAPPAVTECRLPQTDAQHAMTEGCLPPKHAGRPIEGDPLTLPAALLELLVRLSPALCVIDDADQVDPVSLRALAFAARRLEHSRIAMLFTAQDPIEALAGPPTVTLRPLSRASARALLDDLPGPPLPGDVAGALTSAAGGNPLALRELAADLDAQQRRGQAPPPDTLPPSSRLRRAFQARLDRLPPHARRLVLCAAADNDLTATELAAAGLAAADQTQPVPALPEAAPGGPPPGGPPPGELTPGGSAASGPTTHSQAASGKAAVGQAATWPAASGPAASGQTTTGQPPTEQAASERTPARRATNGQAASQQTAPEPTPGGWAAAGRAPSGHTAYDQAAGGLDALDAAERTGLVRVVGDRVVFRPGQLRRVAYQEATVAERREAHRLIAATVNDPLRRARHRAALAAGPDDALAHQLAELAAHACPAAAADALEAAARLATDPAAYRVAAARQAFRAGEPWRARLLLRNTATAPAGVRAEAEMLAGELDLRVDDQPAPHKLVAAAAALVERDRRRALEALVAAGDAMGLTGDYDAYSVLAREAGALRRDGDPAEMELLTDYLAGSAAIYRGDYRRASGPLRRVRALAVRLDAHPALTRACAAAFLLGHDDAARSLGDRAAVLARAHGDVSTVPVAMEFAAGARFALGRHDDAVSALQESADLARESGQTALAGGNLALLAVLAAVHGDPETARLRVCEARRDRVASPGGRGWAVGDWALATVDLLAGRHRAAVRRLAPLMSAGHLVVRVAATPFAVEAAVRAGEPRFAGRLIEMFDRWAPHTGNPDWLALSARCHALVTGEDEHFRRALAEHARGSSEFERARTELLYGEQLRRRRRPIRAREYLRSALDAFQRLDCGWWAARVAAELRAAGETPARPPEQPADTLTSQQMRIAELVAGGATNREVAAKLFLSPRTVDHHLRNIFTRLGIRSRVDLARLMT